MHDAILDLVREATLECLSTLDPSCTRPDLLLACGGFRIANIRGDRRAGEFLSDAAMHRCLLFSNVDPVRLLSMLAGDGVDAILLNDFVCGLCRNDGQVIIDAAKRAAVKTVVLVVPHMRQAAGDKSTWRKEDLWERGFSAERRGPASDEWLVGVWMKAKEAK
jgi:hypothetical protein